MTQLLDHGLKNSSTLQPRTLPISPGVGAAEEFYLHGLGTPVRQIAVQRTSGQAWLGAHVEQGVNRLLQLEYGWDGRRARPVTDEAVKSGIGLLFMVTSDLSLPPQFFPLPDGGLQMEWHAGRSVEVEVDAGGEAHVLVTDESGKIVMNDEITATDEGLLVRTRWAIEELSVGFTRAR